MDSRKWKWETHNMVTDLLEKMKTAEALLVELTDECCGSCSYVNMYSKREISDVLPSGCSCSRFFVAINEIRYLQKNQEWIDNAV